MSIISQFKKKETNRVRDPGNPAYLQAGWNGSSSEPWRTPRDPSGTKRMEACEKLLRGHLPLASLPGRLS